MAILRRLWLVARTLLIVLNNAYCIPAHALGLLALRPMRSLAPRLYWRIEGLCFHWLLAMVSMWSWAARYQTAECGDDVSACVDARTLVLANHQSTADVPMLMATWNARPGVLPNLMWIMDRLFKFTNFGVVSVLHEDFFIQSGRTHRDESLLELARHLRNSYVPRGRNFMVLFPEGGFLRKRKETSQRFATKNNLPLLDHVSLPRAGALKVIMDVVGPRVRPNEAASIAAEDLTSTSAQQSDIDTKENTKDVHQNNGSNINIQDEAIVEDKDRLQWVLDVTIAYPNGKPLDLSTIVYGTKAPCVTYIYYRLYPSHEIPSDHEAMTQWLYTKFYEKEKMLDEFYKTGSFPKKCPDGITRDNNPRIVRQDALRYFILHIFFITYTIFQIHVVWSLYQMCSVCISNLWVH